MKPEDRHKRVADEMQRVIAGAIHSEVKDFDLRMVTVTRCDLARDYSEVKVHYSVLGDAEARRRCATQLSKVAAFVQRRVADQIKLHRAPHVGFEYDSAIDETLRLEQLFDRISRERDGTQ